jgi:parvulin-like peptidyl-prolyl isomerase
MKLTERIKKLVAKKEDSVETHPWLWARLFISGAIIVVVLLACISLIWVYAAPKLFGERGAAIRQHLPYPLVYIAPGRVITYGDFTENTRAVKQFYQNQDFSGIGLRVDFTTEEGKKRLMVRQKEALNKMIEDQALMKIAQENGIMVTEEAAHEGVRRSLDEYGTSDQVQSDLKRLYGWELATFEEKIVTPQLYEEKLRALFDEQEKPNEKAMEQINKAKEALEKGSKFDDVAKQYSEGSTKNDGGSLGWFQVADLAPELQAAIPSQVIGAPSAVVESDLGYHIVMVEEMKKEDGKDLYRLKQIFTKKKLFVDWLADKMKAMHVYVLSPEYRWNQDEARIEFKSENLRMYEEELYKNAEGDALFLF